MDLNFDPQAEFRKPLNDSGNRKYRRRSPLNGSSSSSGGSPDRHISSPTESRKDVEEIDGDKRRGRHRDLDRDLSRSQYSRSGELDKLSDRQSSRNSHSYRRHDDYSKRDKHVDDYDRDYPKSTSRSDWNSRDYYKSDHSKRDYEHQSREYPRDVDKYSRDKSDNLGPRSRDKDKDSSSDRARSGRRYNSIEDCKSGERDKHREGRDCQDGKTDHRRGSGDYKSYYNLKEASQRETKEIDGEKYNKEEKKRFDDRVKYKEQHSEDQEEHSEDRKALSSKDHESIAKKPKLFSSNSICSGKATSADNQSSSFKQAQEASGKVPSEQAYVTDSDIDAAKIAAMKAAELVNKNLVGTGYMSTDQKKKLLWGNKKNTTTEESVRHWDTPTFGDRERQEKFNKLMSLRLPWYQYSIVGRERGRKSGAKAKQPRRREAKGAAPVGSREAVHCWIASEGWSDSWFGSLRIYFRYFQTFFYGFCGVLLCYASRTFVATLVILFGVVCWSVIKDDTLEIIYWSLKPCQQFYNLFFYVHVYPILDAQNIFRVCLGSTCVFKC